MTEILQTQLGSAPPPAGERLDRLLHWAQGMRPVFDLEITPLTFLYDQKLSPALIVGRGMRRSAVMYAQGDDVEDGGIFEDLLETSS